MSNSRLAMALSRDLPVLLFRVDMRAMMFVGNIVVDTVLRHVQGLWGVGAVRGSIGITTVSNMHHSSSPSPSPNNERPTRTIPKKPETYPVTEFCWVAVEDMIIEGAGRRSRDRAHDIEYVGWLWQ
ncbi:hypothetical protein NXS19_000418 [Fusarium pseudograminearum]|nr:hypothetical protein NXS19_000418 [Fusarium pseudograminearum]